MRLKRQKKSYLSYADMILNYQTSYSVVVMNVYFHRNQADFFPFKGIKWIIIFVCKIELYNGQLTTNTWIYRTQYTW